MKHAEASSTSGSVWAKGVLAISLLLLLCAFGWWTVQPWMTPPKGIEPSTSLSLERVEGPWFEVVAPKSSVEVQRGLSSVILFLKYSGPGGDRMPSYRDPNDPRFRIMLMGTPASGEPVTLVETKSHLIKDWHSATLVMPCFSSIPCAFHVIDYDEKNMGWMIVSGWEAGQLRVFSRIPGLPEDLMEKVKGKLAALGSDPDSFRWENNLPPLPKLGPALPEELPPQPKFNFETSGAGQDPESAEEDDGVKGEKGKD